MLLSTTSVARGDRDKFNGISQPIYEVDASSRRAADPV